MSQYTKELLHYSKYNAVTFKLTLKTYFYNNADAKFWNTSKSNDKNPIVTNKNFTREDILEGCLNICRI